jgi:hypothetical protein
VKNVIGKSQKAREKQATKNREYQKKWDALINELVQRKKEGKPVKRIRARIMKLNKEYAGS